MKDTISRQGAIDELVRWDKISDYNDGERNMIACCIAMLSALPTAQEDCSDCLEQIADCIAFAINATNGEGDYMTGLRNGMRLCRSFIDCKEPEYERTKSPWTLCSERMPEDGRYLCDYGDCIDFGRMTNGKWYVDGVIAWMPLPTPYREGGQDG